MKTAKLMKIVLTTTATIKKPEVGDSFHAWGIGGSAGGIGFGRAEIIKVVSGHHIVIRKPNKKKVVVPWLSYVENQLSSVETKQKTTIGRP